MWVRTAFVFSICVCKVAYAQPLAPLPEQHDSDTGYPSPQAAEKALRLKPDVALREENGWLVVTDRQEHTIWSIALKENPAYPTAVKRTVVETNGSVGMDMKVQCGASKDTCDNVVRTFQSLNEKLGNKLRQKQP